uniref:FH2 domain-containing protein n=1 Tax=Macrostomum lignano TaxID=282301 RepID=A0A1I8FQ77_9PLAT
MDESIYTAELLQQMIRFAASSDEIEKYDNYNGPVSKLSKPDQFAYEMTRVPGYEQRLRAMLFKLNFSEKVESIRQTLLTVQRPAGSCAHSDKAGQNSRDDSGDGKFS